MAVYTDRFDIVNNLALDGVPDEDYRIKMADEDDFVYFEILTTENIQERGIVTVLTCKELR